MYSFMYLFPLLVYNVMYLYVTTLYTEEYISSSFCNFKTICIVYMHQHKHWNLLQYSHCINILWNFFFLNNGVNPLFTKTSLKMSLN